ncbi:Ig-like domain-containing protein, partial [Candidatus Poribacteria bacterium]
MRRHSKLLISRILAVSLFLVGPVFLTWAGESAVFGPEDFVREAGKPVVTTSNFSVLKPDEQFFLRVYNGGVQNLPDKLVSSAIISINGEQVLKPKDFGIKVKFVEVSVALQLDNTISVELRSEIGSFLTLSIVGSYDTAPNIQIISPPDGSLTNVNPYDIALIFSDDISGVDPSSFSLSINGIDKTGSFSVEATGLSGSASGTLLLSEGTNKIEASIADFEGNTGTATATFIVDTTPPEISIISPENGSTIPTLTPLISVSYDDATSGVDISTLQILIDGTDYTGSFNITPTGASYQLPPEQALEDGEHTIQASISDMVGNVAKATSIFQVETVETLESLSILPINPRINLGQSQQFSAIGVQSDGTVVDITDQAIWTSSDPSVATIGANGLAASHDVGSTEIGASKGAIIAVPRTLTVAQDILPIQEPDSAWIVGMVYDSRSGLALEGARVTVEGVEGVVYSDSNGQFFYPCPGSDIYRVF